MSSGERMLPWPKDGVAALNPRARVVLCVDLDGTLVKTDTLLELLIRLLKRNPLYLFVLPLWFIRGKAHFKARVAAHEALETGILPLQRELVEFVREQRLGGRRTVLVTGANRAVAAQVAAHVGCFDEVIASDEAVNMSGAAKRDALVARFGERGFDYVGNELVDLPVLTAAREALIAGPSLRLGRALRAAGVPVARVFDDRPSALAAFVSAIRVKQWVKNLLIAVPLVLAHKVRDPHRLLAVALAMLAFCLASSSAYLLNDLLDLDADRHHPIKKNRPLACGDLPMTVGVAAAPALLVAAIAISLALPRLFTLSLLAYFICTLSYSLYLKRAVLIDVMMLAGLYTLRILAGGAAATVEISQWLAAFSTFFFLSLALLKRYSELQRLLAEKRLAPRGRGYTTRDVQQISAFGSGSGYVAALVMALYINSPEVTRLYSHPQWLWLMCALVIYWISRAWLLADRGELHDDPILFALTDKVSYAVGAVAGLILLAASW
jgi:4-hydroxybenzoate polyprenyltransferase/phosphoserine phosphatase